jgi:hypothetical protein
MVSWVPGSPVDWAATHREAHLHELARGEVAAVAQGAHPPRRLAGEHRADAHPLDAGDLDGVCGLGIGILSDNAGRRRRDAGDPALDGGHGRSAGRPVNGDARDSRRRSASPATPRSTSWFRSLSRGWQIGERLSRQRVSRSADPARDATPARSREDGAGGKRRRRSRPGLPMTRGRFSWFRQHGLALNRLELGRMAVRLTDR